MREVDDCLACDDTRPNAAAVTAVRELAAMPPVDLRERVSGTRDQAWFDTSGQRTVAEWARALASAGLRLDHFERVVDFGCGCGRALRFLPERLRAGHTLFALDTDPEAIAWVDLAMPGVTALTLDPLPPVPMADASVDLVLSHSVFTHLPEDVQFKWLQELHRLLGPGGVLVTSVHGRKAFADFLHSLPGTPLEPTTSEISQAMARDGFCHLSGKTHAERSYPHYYGTSFHDLSYIARSWLQWFDLLAWHPTFALDLQDVLVMRAKRDRADAPAPCCSSRREGEAEPRETHHATAPGTTSGGGSAEPVLTGPIDLDRYFRDEGRRALPYGGQNTGAFQRALATYHRDVRAEDCDFYHVIELEDGRRFGGDWDLRGHEAEYLGGISLTGKSVIEFGPASGWLSQHIAHRAAALTVLDLPFGSAPDIMPFPGIDADACRRSGAANITRLRNSWWFARGMLGFSATAIYADIYDPPTDLGSFDVAVFGSILLHLSHPFRALQRAAERTRETIVVTDVVSPQEDLHMRAPGLDPAMALMAFGPTPPPIGVVHWWALSSGAVTLMLRRLGFTQTTMTRHRDMPLFTVVGHRPR